MSCPACDFKLRTEGPRQSEAHFAVRFGDTTQFEVLLDGEKICNCVEVMAGPGGWALRVPEDPWCPCGKELHSVALYLDRNDGYSVRSITTTGRPLRKGEFTGQEEDLRSFVARDPICGWTCPNCLVLVDSYRAKQDPTCLLCGASLVWMQHEGSSEIARKAWADFFDDDVAR